MFTPFRGRRAPPRAHLQHPPATSRSSECRLGNVDRLRAFLYISGRDRAWNGAGDKVARIHCKTRPLDGRAETASRRHQAQDRDRQSASRAPRLGRSARCVARQGGDGAGLRGRAHQRPQHQRRDQHAGFGQRPNLRLVHPWRGDGTRGDDRLAQSHHRPRPRDFSRAALGARCRLGAVRRILQQRRAVSLLPPAAAAQAAQAAGGARHELARWSRDRMVSAAGRG